MIFLDNFFAFILDDFFFRALLGGVCLAVISGPFGCFIVWRQMAFIGDSLAHASLLGIALSLLFEVNTTLGILTVCVLFTGILLLLQTYSLLPMDTLLGVISHSMLAIGLVALSFFERLNNIDLFSYLLGDILAVSRMDLVWIFGFGTVTFVGMLRLWRPLLAITVDEDLARTEGINGSLIYCIFLLLLALLIGMMIKIVGILLVASLLLLPAATARSFVRTPEQMAVLAVLFGIIAVVGGLYFSLVIDLPTGPSIVVMALTLFIMSQVVGVRLTKG